MAYPAAYDIFTGVKKRGNVVTENIGLPASATPVVSTVSYPILSTVTVPGYTEVSTTPAANQFQVFYGTTTIVFGPFVFPSTVAVTYTTKGTLISDLPIQGLITAVTSIESTLGLNPQGAYATLVARLLAIEAGGTHTHNIYDFSSACDGTNVTFVLPQTPTQPNATMAVLNACTYTTGYGFTISGDTITFTVAPSASSSLVVFYIV